MDKCTQNPEECKQHFNRIEKDVKELNEKMAVLRLDYAGWQKDVRRFEEYIQATEYSIRELDKKSNEHGEALAKLEENLNNLKEVISELKKSQEMTSKKLDEKFDKLTWWLIGLFSTAAVSIILTIVNQVLGKK